jgi:hypothetical protein
MPEKRYAASEITSLGQDRYERDIRAEIEAAYRGKLLALDVDSGCYAIGDDSVEAIERLEAMAPEARVCVLRVGFPSGSISSRADLCHGRLARPTHSLCPRHVSSPFRAYNAGNRKEPAPCD